MTERQKNFLFLGAYQDYKKKLEKQLEREYKKIDKLNSIDIVALGRNGKRGGISTTVMARIGRTYDGINKLKEQIEILEEEIGKIKTLVNERNTIFNK